MKGGVTAPAKLVTLRGSFLGRRRSRSRVLSLRHVGLGHVRRLGRKEWRRSRMVSCKRIWESKANRG